MTKLKQIMKKLFTTVLGFAIMISTAYLMLEALMLGLSALMVGCLLYALVEGQHRIANS